jgi:hypothetical protein
MGSTSTAARPENLGIPATPISARYRSHGIPIKSQFDLACTERGGIRTGFVLVPVVARDLPTRTVEWAAVFGAGPAILPGWICQYGSVANNVQTNS